MITNTSRYYANLWERDGVVYNIATKGEKYTSNKTVLITSVDGDTFDKIAARVLGDSTQYWKIASINQTVRFPDFIPAGTVIAIPIS
jgi:nucleoid-associated protein YgaU